MIHLLFAPLGGLFAWITTGALVAALGIGAVLYVYSADLPSHESLAQYQPPTISRIYSSEGRIIDEFARERRLFVPVDEIPDLVKHAFVSAEDKNFYRHAGYDPRAIAAAAVEAVETRGGSVRGASTIPQQVAKNVFLSGDRTAERKFKEVVLAARMVASLGRDRILEVYLNEIDLGFRAFGVASAAQVYFNKTLDELAPEEAAYLAALPKAPYDYHPVRQREAAVARRDYVLREMRENGYLTDAAYQVATAAPLRTVQAGDYPSFREAMPPRDYFTDEIRRQLTDEFGDDQFFSGGLSVRATVDPQMQDAAAASLRQALEEYDRSLRRWRGTGETIEALEDWRPALAAADVPRDVTLGGRWHPAVVLDAGADARLGVEDVAEEVALTAAELGWPGADRADEILSRGDVVLLRRDEEGWTLRQVPEVEGAFVAMDVDTGRVLAMQGGFSYQDSVFNRATQADRQPGSSFKPFVYAAALDSGFTPATIVVDAPIEIDTGTEIWRPRNASNRYYGPTPLRTGIERSRNLMTIRLAQEVGMDTVARYAESFGVYDEMGPYLSNALGSEETTLYQMVAAYAMFANGGERVRPTLVDRIQDRYGRTIYRHDRSTCADCGELALPAGQPPTVSLDRERVMDPVTAYQLTSMMKGVVDRGTAARTVGAALDVPVAGKTGTTNDAKDVWFVGFTSEIVAGCYIGYDQPRSLGDSASGGGMCGPVFARFMAEAVERYGAGEFAVPPGGRFIRIDRHSGNRLADDATGENVVAEYFRLGEEPVFGVGGMVDGGFAMSADLPRFGRGESDDGPAREVVTSTGERATIAPRASFGSLSSGGLY
jgi:penicillin-binding protein 1A